MSLGTVYEWLGTELGLPVFVRVVKQLTSAEEFELLLRWASRREPHLCEAEIERMEALARMLAELLERWEPVEFAAAERSVVRIGRK